MSKRGETVTRLRQDGLTWAKIGSLLGVSRQRAHQLAEPPKLTEKRKAYMRRYMREYMRRKKSRTQI
jgi:hypothetical protein